MRETTIYVALDVGCLECGESTTVVGLYATKEEARAVLDPLKQKQEADWQGQHSFQVHVLALPSFLTFATPTPEERPDGQ